MFCSAFALCFSRKCTKLNVYAEYYQRVAYLRYPLKYCSYDYINQYVVRSLAVNLMLYDLLIIENKCSFHRKILEYKCELVLNNYTFSSIMVHFS